MSLLVHIKVQEHGKLREAKGCWGWGSGAISEGTEYTSSEFESKMDLIHARATLQRKSMGNKACPAILNEYFL